MSAFFVIMRFLPFLLLLAAVFYVVTRIRNQGQGNQTHAVGRLVSNALAEEKIEKRLKALAISAVLVFVADCIVLIVILMIIEFPVALGVVGCVLGCLVLVSGVVGIVFSQVLSLKNRKSFFMLLFAFITFLGLLVSTAFSIVIYLMV
jgi:hypothetical protein